VLERLFDSELPLDVKGTLNLVIDRLVSKKHLSPKQKQDTKNALNKIKDAFNNSDNDGIESAMEKIIAAIL
jgi:hypothetical protein